MKPVGLMHLFHLAYHPEENELEIDNFTAGLEDLKSLCNCSSYFLDNFKHIKAYWIMITDKLGTSFPKFWCKRYRWNGCYERANLSCSWRTNTRKNRC